MLIANKLVPELLVGYVFVRNPAEIRKHLKAEVDTAGAPECFHFIGLEKVSMRTLEPARDRFIRRICLQVDAVRAVKKFIDNSSPGITEEKALAGLKSVYLKVIEKLKKEDPLLAMAIKASLHKEAHELVGRHVTGEPFLNPVARSHPELQIYKSIFVTTVRMIKAHFECHKEPGEFEKQLAERLESVGAERSAASIEHKAYWTNVYIDPSQCRPNSRSTGTWNREICLIVAERDDKVATHIREHVEVHARVARSDEFGRISPHPGEDILRNLTRFSVNQSVNTSYTKISQALNIKPIILLRMFKEELIAEFRSFVRDEKERNKPAWHSFSTASNDCIRFCASIIRFQNEIGKVFPELCDKAMRLAEQVAEMFERTTLDIAKLSYVSTGLGKRAVDVVEAAMLVLPPDKYHRIMDILALKFGKEKVDGMSRLYHDAHPHEEERLMDFAAQYVRSQERPHSYVLSFLKYLAEATGLKSA